MVPLRSVMEVGVASGISPGQHSVEPVAAVEHVQEAWCVLHQGRVKIRAHRIPDAGEKARPQVTHGEGGICCCWTQGISYQGDNNDALPVESDTAEASFPPCDIGLARCREGSQENTDILQRFRDTKDHSNHFQFHYTQCRDLSSGVFNPDDRCLFHVAIVTLVLNKKKPIKPSKSCTEQHTRPVKCQEMAISPLHLPPGHSEPVQP